MMKQPCVEQQRRLRRSSSEWQKRVDQDTLESKQAIHELQMQVKDFSDQLRQRDTELVEFERKYARSSASLEVSQKEANCLKTN